LIGSDHYKERCGLEKKKRKEIWSITEQKQQKQQISDQQQQSDGSQKKTNQIRNQLFSNSPSQTQTKGIARTFGMMRTSHIHTNTNVE